jgi:hypothetical protein
VLERWPRKFSQQNGYKNLIQMPNNVYSTTHATDLDEDVGAGVSLAIENLERIFQNLEMKGRSQQFPALPPLLVGAQLWTQLKTCTDTACGHSPIRRHNTADSKKNHHSIHCSSH